MTVLFVGTYKPQYTDEHLAPFIVEQGRAVSAQGVTVRFIALKGNYVKRYIQLRRAIRTYEPDIIHAHYGLTCLLATLQGRVPVISTYHGSDINDEEVRIYSVYAILRSAHNILVSRKMLDILETSETRSGKPALVNANYSVIPCGIDLNTVPNISHSEARSRLNISEDEPYILFSGSFDNVVKNPELAKHSVYYLGQLLGKEVQLHELSGLTRDEVMLRFVAADVMLMTSHTEGSPQVIKEAMACGCPIVSVDVGDVRERLSGLEGCYVAQIPELVNGVMMSQEDRALEIAQLLEQALQFKGRIKGREHILKQELDNKQIAQKIIAIYDKTLHR